MICTGAWLGAWLGGIREVAVDQRTKVVFRDMCGGVFKGVFSGVFRGVVRGVG